MSKRMTTVRYTGTCRDCGRTIEIGIEMPTEAVADDNGKHARCAKCRTISTVRRNNP